jgi:hydrogenase large subunit
MCFKNLPVEFDDAGVATLRGGIPDPYALEVARPEVAMTEEERQAKIQQLMARNGHVKDLNMDPVTRVAGALAMHVVADLEEGRYADAHAQTTLFRGYEVIAMGRDPRDAIFITSRACGVCGGVHSHAAAYALEMAMGLSVPPMGTCVRNMQEAAEMGYDNPMHLYLLAGPDYSESVVKQANPELWPKAERWRCPSSEHHGFDTMAELMEGLNPLTGSLYKEGLDFTRVAREQFVLFAGKFPHPQTVVPGGVSSTVHMTTLNEFHSRLVKTFDYAQRMIAVWDDLADFFYEADDRYRMVGYRPTSHIDDGYWDDPFAYDATYANANDWGDRRASTPGVVVDGELLTTRLTDINIGIEEFVEHAYYDNWSSTHFETDHLDSPLSPYHPWNKRTLPKPTEKSWKDKYTWATSPRWDRQVLEVGAYSRLLMTALAQKRPPSRFIEATGDSLRMLIPKGEKHETVAEWKVPEVWNAFERNRGRAYHYLFAQLVALENLLTAYELMKTGDDAVASVNAAQLKKVIPKDERRGIGYWGAGRGMLLHWCVLDQGRITNYQIVTPSTFNASPRDPWGQPGPFEEAVMNTPIIERPADSSGFTGIDFLRALRSFDPCLPCAAHVYTGDGVITREVNTCACGAD